MRKYHTCARLNAEGKVVLGDIFPDGEAPVQNVIPQIAKLEGIEGLDKVFLVDWKELTAHSHSFQGPKWYNFHTEQKRGGL